MKTRLVRKVRFAAEGRGDRGNNGFAGSPPIQGLGPFLECAVVCVGEPDPESGYLVNIKVIDQAVHQRVRPLLERACAAGGTPDLPALLSDSLDGLSVSLPVPVDEIELALSPYHVVAMADGDRNHAQVRLRFDFAASHRLHVPEWTDAANREHFGKCNNSNGHGHNYQLEVRIALPSGQARAVSVYDIESVVQEVVIDRFDHKHLNLDTKEFADGTGLNPTVENIAQTCHALLAEPVAGLGAGVVLSSVRVWETDRTSSEYPA